MNDDVLALRKAVWPHVTTIMKSTDGKAVSDAAIAIIALVQQDTARRLLSDKAKIAAAHHMQELAAQGVWDNRVHAYEGMKAALAAIGIEQEDE